jgi:hypothetical protein
VESWLIVFCLIRVFIGFGFDLTLQNVAFFSSYLEFHTMDEVQKTSDSEWYTPLSEHFIFNVCYVSVRGAAEKTPIRTPASASMHLIVFSSLRYQSHTARRQGHMAQPRHETVNASMICHISSLDISHGTILAYRTIYCVTVVFLYISTV